MPKVEVKFDTFPLQGGLDQQTPQLSLKPGVARSAVNYECSISGGYTRIPGYERFDGRTSPSSAVYLTLLCTAVVGLSVGDAVNGQTSGATGTVAAIDGLVVVLTKLSGTFVVSENLRKVVTVAGVISTVGVTISDQTTLATYQLAAAAIYRADIAVVPGSGSILGLWVINDLLYAVRNNAGGTAAAIYKQSAGGWVNVPLSYEVGFTGGSGTAPVAGATITKGAVSAVVRKVVIESGSFSGTNAAGRFITDAPTGGTFTAGAFTAGVTATAAASLTGGLVQAAITLLPGGRFETALGNAGNGVMIYGADGVNRGFEFDGTYLVPIKTGQTIDTPSHVCVHMKHVFFSFVSSAQYSGAGTPYQWTALSGAAEIAVNQSITAFLVLAGTNVGATSVAGSGALAIISTNTTSILYGTGSADFNLVELNGKIGSKAYGAQRLADGYVYDDNGIISLTAVKEFGNFAPDALTVNIRSFVQARKTLVTASLVNREKSQYRVYYSDGYGLYCTIINGRMFGAMPVLFLNPVTCTANGVSTNAGEVSYFGSTNGFVYRMDVGTSFDGSAITHNLDLAFNAEGNARVRKRYRKAVFEIQGDAYAEFSGGWTMAYGVETTVATVLQTSVAGVYWDSFTWDEFVWDGRAIAPSQLSIEGSAENISIGISGSSALWPAFTINSVTLHYTPRRIMR